MRPTPTGRAASTAKVAGIDLVAHALVTGKQLSCDCGDLRGGNRHLYVAGAHLSLLQHRAMAALERLCAHMGPGLCWIPTATTLTKLKSPRPVARAWGCGGATTPRRSAHETTTARISWLGETHLVPSSLSGDVTLHQGFISSNSSCCTHNELRDLHTPPP